MRTALLILPALIALVTSCSNDALEGTWNCASAVVDGKPLSEKTVGLLRLTLTPDRYKTQKGTEVLFDSSYTIDPSKKPKQIDMVGTEGELTGKKAQGIYDVRGHQLWICYTMPGKKRPTTFESKAGSEAYFIIWKPAKTSALSFWFRASLPKGWDAVVVCVAGLLLAYLSWRIWQRTRLPEALWTGHGIDVSDISGRVQQVRNDFVSELHNRPHEFGNARALVKSACKLVAQFAYFRSRKQEESDEAMHSDTRL